MRKALAIVCFTLAVNAHAATFVVDSTSPTSLALCVDGVPADCSLVGALTKANQTTAADWIHFQIPQSDAGYQPLTQHWRIAVSSALALPAIDAPVTIDGYTQPGAIANTLTPDQGGLNGVLKIEIRGAQAFGNQGPGFNFGNGLSQSGSVFRGLAISNFNSAMILLSGQVVHRVEGCYLGTDILGTSAGQSSLSNSGFGITVFGQGAYVVGGLLPAERNLISGMRGAFSNLGAANGMRIQGNLIGTDATGSAPIGNEIALYFTEMTNSLIGGTESAARNVISASRFYAIGFSASSAGAFAGTRVEGNYFGTDVSGGKRLGNGTEASFPTILGQGAGCQMSIGGLAPGQANLIAFGGGAGIQSDRCNGLRSTFNRFYGNRSVPFDNVFGGGALGPTPNDPNDADETGGNRLQNYPDITVLSESPVSASLQLRVDTAVSNATYPITVNFYRGGCGGGSDAYLSSSTISAVQAQQTLSVTLNDTLGVFPLTATAVDALGNTSEFAPMLGDVIYRTDFEVSQAPLTPGICR